MQESPLTRDTITIANIRKALDPTRPIPSGAAYLATCDPSSVRPRAGPVLDQRESGDETAEMRSFLAGQPRASGVLPVRFCLEAKIQETSRVTFAFGGQWSTYAASRGMAR